MSNNNQSVQRDWQLYQSGLDYKNRIELFSTVDKNNRFYDGKQWDGVVSNGLPTPVFNVIKRVLQYKISNIMQNDVTINFSAENVTDEQRAMLEILNKEMANYWEKLKMQQSNRKVLKDAAIQGDGITYYYFDSTAKTGQKYGYEEILGEICKEEIDNVSIFPGDCNNPIINTATKPVQPYILLVFRQTVGKIKEYAKQNGVKEKDLNYIVSDDETTYTAGDKGKIELEDYTQENEGKANVILKLWYNSDTETIWARRSTKFVILKDDYDTELKLYPVAAMNWEEAKNSFHGTAEVTGIIPNQIYINKSAAMIMLATMYVSYPKLIFDKTRIVQPSNQIGVAIGVEGEVSGAAQYLNPGQISSDVYRWFEMVVQYTKEMMGANEAALGEVDPKNTSAIIAVQQASAIPLEMVRERFYQYIEDIALIWFDMIRAKYKVPRQISFSEKGQEYTEILNMSVLDGIIPKVKIDVGASSKWSEIAAMQTLDNLFNSGKITDIEYFERIPDQFIKDKQGLIEARKKIQQEQEAMAKASNKPITGQDLMGSLSPEEQQYLQENPDLLNQLGG